VQKALLDFNTIYLVPLSSLVNLGRLEKRKAFFMASNSAAQWSTQDEFFSTLFRHWDDLPPHSEACELRVLRHLDKIIVPFEQATQHSHAGFVAWCRRHQAAMEAGITAVPGYPNLKTRMGNWREQAWEARYAELVHLRQTLAMKRLQRLAHMIPPALLKAFFREEVEAPRGTFRNSTRRGFKEGLRCFWYHPLDILLATLANNWDIDEEKISALFWGRDQTDPRPKYKGKKTLRNGSSTTT
jgi:hypothetical protein